MRIGNVQHRAIGGHTLAVYESYPTQQQRYLLLGWVWPGDGLPSYSSGSGDRIHDLPSPLATIAMSSLRHTSCSPLLLGLCTLAQLWAVAGASWWSLALWAPNFDPSEYQLLCIMAPGLSPEQRRICRQHPIHVPHVAEGARLALAECQHQFRAKRWNCTTPGAEDALDPIARSGSREAAFVSAITAAGVVHAVARACGQGALRDICPLAIPQTMRLLYNTLGYGDALVYGYQFAKRFVDASEHDRRRLGGGGWQSLAKLVQMNLHNNEAGRLAVYNLASVDCKCHFEFGICVLQVCSPHLADFRKVGNFLKEKYDTSSAMRLVSHKRSGRRGGAAGAVTGGATRWSRWRLEPVNEWLTAPTASELVHVSASPNYCERDDASGIPGAVGRRCNVTSEGTEGCSVITCCDRGYDISQVTVEKQCGCKEQLRWNVRCKLCPSTVDQYFCK
ncbi:protein Wnt-5a-like [Callorhinchus milii]|uniref:protein Wnt-5a-like n=1 Tax=Callorhinchus milii TaxID=7868 RepID=UPI001C3F571A|nr:protein Wnt-5a-like [Callorhinchus milii]